MGTIEIKTSASAGYFSKEFATTADALAYIDSLLDSGTEVLNVLGLPIEGEWPDNDAETERSIAQHEQELFERLED